MKFLFFILIWTINVTLFAQNGFKKTNNFVRVYELNGKKISKGKILSISETSIQLIREVDSFVIATENIGSIKTKRSEGNNIITGAATGAFAMVILSLATYEEPPSSPYGTDFGPGANAIAGAIIGIPVGAAVGGITIFFKNSKTYKINGDTIKLKEFKEMMLK